MIIFLYMLYWIAGKAIKSLSPDYHNLATSYTTRRQNRNTRTLYNRRTTISTNCDTIIKKARAEVFRVSKHISRITVNPEICHGKPTIRNLRYTVENILELLSAGMNFDEILSDYEDLEREDILATLEYATKLAQIKKIDTITAA